MKIIPAPRGMPVESWAVVNGTGPTITGFSSAEAAKAWATEWNCLKVVISPVCNFVPATAALTAYERHAQNLEEGEGWKNG